MLAFTLQSTQLKQKKNDFLRQQIPHKTNLIVWDYYSTCVLGAIPIIVKQIYLGTFHIVQKLNQTLSIGGIVNMLCFLSSGLRYSDLEIQFNFTIFIFWQKNTSV